MNYINIVHVQVFTGQGLRLRTQNALDMAFCTSTIPAYVTALLDAGIITIDYRS
ncbi:hypothetical protein [Marinomonas ostreistagni]|uniref:Uncharacterized protein n=1 Tax=Marinomonas ostreistagni TaxID=359209 RepID=A0ABS0ZBD6_9GAMM|nr:hypothetical protein [Marinomonas ostreistagni]MBJ7550962.1 hypothetical protein [Marinomonas ostreistagni]